MPCSTCSIFTPKGEFYSHRDHRLGARDGVRYSSTSPPGHGHSIRPAGRRLPRTLNLLPSEKQPQPTVPWLMLTCQGLPKAQSSWNTWSCLVPGSMSHTVPCLPSPCTHPDTTALQELVAGLSEGCHTEIERLLSRATTLSCCKKRS